jgi:hypothetical protein
VVQGQEFSILLFVVLLKGFEMSFVFVQLSHNYADEFDVDCCFVAPKPHFEADLEKIKEFFEKKSRAYEEFYFGTNEFLQFDNFNTFMNGVTVKECTEQFYDEFKALTGGGSVGYNVMESILDQCR